jgi:hypothetical protein
MNLDQSADKITPSSGTLTVAGTLTISTLSDGTNSTSATNPIKGSARAWVNYNGSTQTVVGSYNISSVTYVSSAYYTLNFTTAMPNANYVVTGIAGSIVGGSAKMLVPAGAQTTTTCPLTAYVYNASQTDSSYFAVAIFSS